MEKKKLIIIGDGEFAGIAFEYFTMDSEYQVAAFAVEKSFRKKDTFMQLPVVDFEALERLYPPEGYDAFVAITYVRLNHVRERLFHACKKKGYRCATYVSSRAFVWPNVGLGENDFIFENCTVQYRAKLGDNVIVWSGSCVAHRTVIEENCWLAPKVAVAGFCHIGKNSFLGINSTVGDYVEVPKETVLAAGACTVKSLTGKGKVFAGVPARESKKSAYEVFI